MCSDRAKLIQSGLLLTLILFLTACDGGNDASCASAPASAPVSAPAPAPSPAPAVTSMGTDFYLTLPDHLCVSVPSNCPGTSVTNKLIVAAPTATTGSVTFNTLTTTFSVAAGGQTEITLDTAVVLTTNEVIESKGIHVTAQSPISVHVVSESAYSADGYLALPTTGLGTSYYVMSYASTSQTGSEFAVVATQNNTTVTITPKAAGLTKPANAAFTVVLNSGETYQFENPAYADMTGSLVTADKPIAVFSGHRFANLPSGVGYGDYLVEQLPDVSIWGKTHHTSLFSGRTNYTVRVMASQNGTTFTTTPAGLIGTLNAGQFADVDLAVAGEFVSNNPVLVAQFMRGSAEETALAAKGDPSMVIVTPVEQAVTDATFGVHGLAGTSLTSPAYMNVVTETTALASLKLDNVVVDPALFASVSGASIYSTGTIPVAPGAHTLQGSVPYSALVYDYGIASNSVSYAYPVAAKLSPPAPATPIPVPVVSAPAPVNPASAACVNNQGAGVGQSRADIEHDHEDTEHDGDARNDNHGHHDDGEAHDTHA
ncbi:MAG: hypothetical protein ABI479_08560 [Gallionella sp.]